jgi:RNA polymerase sigma-70 factor (ECF subfamily)
MSPAAPPADLAAAREQFLALVDAVRPDLHRYGSRLVGSAIDGEDVVQETLAKAFYALSQLSEMPPLRPWLFRIAHNTAIDFLRRYERRHAAPLPEDEHMPSDDLPRDPEVLRAAIATFMTLPLSQRSAVILKDVLDQSLADIAQHLDTSVAAVKSLLVRGRQALKAHAAGAQTPAPASPSSPEHRALVRRYVELFNQRDWVGVQALLIEECRLDLVSKSQRKGKSVGMYFGRYAQEQDLVFRTGTCEGRSAIGVFRVTEAAPEALAYVILVESEGDRVSFIRDFRYVPYLARELHFVPDVE